MYIITGATGQVGSKISKILLESGKPVRVIGRGFERLKPFMIMGAEPYEGDLEDTDFLAKAFSRATAVFSMIPPNMKAEKVRKYQQRISDSIIRALKKSGVTHVVNLSSIGAHLPGKTGPIAGLHDHEEALNKLRGLNVVHLRAAYFMENLLFNVELMRHQGINGYPLNGDLAIPMIATRDIARIAAQCLSDLSFSGKSVRYLLGQRDLTLIEATEIIGKAIGKPGLRYVQFPYEDAEKALIGMGMSSDAARSYMEMERSVNEGLIIKGAEKEMGRAPQNTTETPIEEFAREEFAERYCIDNPECKASGF
ncbi:MAG: hypothetical protein A2W19_12165 [Spirochaetes bacterium RBG_16_49_21]|nr:MAG: hypothetical protein A2W19_12165 [Spirochaetes bacterium RBG_16_49_21]